MISTCRHTTEHHGGLESLIAFVRATLPSTTYMAEIGCWAGESTVMFAQNFTVVYAVDAWSEQSFAFMRGEGFLHAREDVEASFDERAAHFRNIVKIKDYSAAAAKLFRSLLDFVYIDAAHDYESVRNDIAAWLPTLRSDRRTIIAGHDYEQSHPGVMQAVDERFGPTNLHHFPDGSWLKVMEVEAHV